MCKASVVIRFQLFLPVQNRYYHIISYIYYLYGSLFQPLRKNEKGNCNLSHNSDFFLTIASLHLTTLTFFILVVASFYLTILRRKKKSELWDKKSQKHFLFSFFFFFILWQKQTCIAFLLLFSCLKHITFYIIHIFGSFMLKAYSTCWTARVW